MNASSGMLKRIALSVLVACYITGAIIAGSPTSSLTIAWANTIKPVFNFFGLYNNYGVFAPDPAKYNQEFHAVIKFHDGTTKTWKFPSLLDYKEDVMKQLKLPWVEWEYYFGWDAQNIVLLPDAARYITYIHRNASNQPVEVDIYRDYEDIALPGKGNGKGTLSSLDLKYIVKEEDLK